ncbi:MAG: 16S rRNA (uracil(1498)-N(3))-methyltransferase [Gammaproteobacteria bacterium]|nr:16S rRNA (uracil(1498)-N(3))-methyltransferase [Gammaproteobacteria bacterium]
MATRLNRIFHDEVLTVNQRYTLSDGATRHLVTVLRVKQNEPLILFNGDGQNYLARVTQVAKRSLEVEVVEQQANHSESPLATHLIQAVARGDKMDWVIQKAVELGVTEITPLFTERTGVKLTSDRLAKKRQHWQQVAISACEQSGRSQQVAVHQPIVFDQLLGMNIKWRDSIILHPHRGESVAQLHSSSAYNLIIGPEGGLTEDEVDQLAKLGSKPLTLGPRILRTETAALVMLSILQSRFGDLL